MLIGAALLLVAGSILIAIDGLRRPRYRLARLAVASGYLIASLWCLVAVRLTRQSKPPPVAPVERLAPPTVSDSLRIVPQIGHSDGVFALAFSEDCRLLASLGDGQVKIWDTATGILRVTLRTRVPLRTQDGGELQWSRDARVLKAWDWSDPAEPQLWDARTGDEWEGPAPAELDLRFDVKTADKRLVRQLMRAQGRIVFSRDNQKIAFRIDTLDSDNPSDADILVWERGKARTVYHGGIYALALSSDGRKLAFSSLNEWREEGGLKIVDARSGKSLGSMEKGRGNRLDFCPDGRLLAAGADEGIQIWDVESRALLRTLPGQRDVVEDVAFSADGRWLFTRASTDGEERMYTDAENDVHVWDLHAGRLQATVRTELRQAAWGHDGRLVTAGRGVLRWWRPEDGSPHATLRKQGYFALGPDGRSVASSSEENRLVRIWDARTGTARVTLPKLERHVVQIAWSGAGNRLIVATDCDANSLCERIVTSWDAEIGKQVASISSYGRFAMSPDGRTMAVNKLDERHMLLLDIPTWTERATLAMPCDNPYGRRLAFSPDGETLAVASCNELIVQLWDARSGALRRQFPVPGGDVSSIAYHPNGLTIALAGPNGLRLHRLSDGASLALTALAGSKDKWVGLVTAEDGRWGGNPEVSRRLRVRQAGEDLRSAEMPAARLSPELGWHSSLLPDFLANRLSPSSSKHPGP
jgi:WD40 repeat protein